MEVDSSSLFSTLHSECGIKETIFTYPLPPRSWCQRLSFIVTPQNLATIGGSSVAKSFTGTQIRKARHSYTLIVHLVVIIGPEVIEILYMSKASTIINMVCAEINYSIL